MLVLDCLFYDDSEVFTDEKGAILGEYFYEIFIPQITDEIAKSFNGRFTKKDIIPVVEKFLSVKGIQVTANAIEGIWNRYKGRKVR